ncbi:hypothetical protein B6U67_01810 [Methanosarcinales archaeon ex4484_138]|nr:MAG: hypothetical protein B6U67_01810 [Methanosarcinales archaeon ex4484_138]
MNIEDQVVSLELAKKLKEIGVGSNEYQPETIWRWKRLKPDGWYVGESSYFFGGDNNQSSPLTHTSTHPS